MICEREQCPRALGRGTGSVQSYKVRSRVNLGAKLAEQNTSDLQTLSTRGTALTTKGGVATFQPDVLCDSLPRLNRNWCGLPVVGTVSEGSPFNPVQSLPLDTPG